MDCTIDFIFYHRNSMVCYGKYDEEEKEEVIATSSCIILSV